MLKYLTSEAFRMSDPHSTQMEWGTRTKDVWLYTKFKYEKEDISNNR